jgi:hypothetical protein
MLGGFSGRSALQARLPASVLSVLVKKVMVASNPLQSRETHGHPPVIPRSPWSPCHSEELMVPLSSRRAHGHPPVIPRSNATRNLPESADISRRIPECRFLTSFGMTKGRERHPEALATRDLLEVARFLTASRMAAIRANHIRELQK